MLPKLAVISGASSGIGYAAALYLAQAGWQVMAGVRTPQDADKLRHDSVTQGFTGLMPVMLEITDASSIEGVRRQAQDWLSRQQPPSPNGQQAEPEQAVSSPAYVLAVINNAGYSLAGPLEHLPIEAIRHQLEVNVLGSIALTQALLPLLKGAQRGRLVMMSSISGRISLPYIGPYAASKHALEAIADAWRVELDPWGVCVSVIQPGAVQTPIWQRAQTQAQQLSAQFPAEAWHDYGADLQRFNRLAQRCEQTGMPVSAVVQAIHHAVSHPRPKARYLLGADAKRNRWLNHLPAAWRDGLIRWGLRGRFGKNAP
ncbi:MAG: SDR family NAD(P)-dependent oxidoreductase [Candidatus Melainabacteria bacterium]|nr:SDR family NAD(P)-dependent oxidoreductase [Candidatus Melainabacteria bacterium]